MYSYEILPEARDQVGGLPNVALIYYAELITFVELTPWDAPPYRDDNPDGNMRKIVFGRLAKASPSILRIKNLIMVPGSAEAFESVVVRRDLLRGQVLVMSGMPRLTGPVG